MKPEKESCSFGLYLQSIRLAKNITLQKVAEETRIANSNLKLIEKEDIESLPDAVFVKGFLRSYAQAIGADENEAVRLYEARLDMESRLEEAGHIAPQSALLPWRNLFLSIVAVLGLIALSLYGVSYFQHQTTQMEKVETPAGGSEHSQGAPAADQSASDAKKETPPETRTNLVLQITAIEDTWVKIIVDNQEPKEYNLRPGDQVEENATEGYNLLIGNAGGLELKLNGESVKISGKDGEIVNIQLP
jgi:cytoskeletal protein RodZ